MPSRAILARELAELLKVLAHPDRVRLIEELRGGSLDVTALSERLGVSATRMSQHLALMKSHRIVVERRDGRHHQYGLAERALAAWLLDGSRFVHARIAADQADSRAIDLAAQLWRDNSTKDGDAKAPKSATGDHHGQDRRRRREVPARSLP